MQEINVVCRSDDSYPQRPVAFDWEDEKLEIKSIISRSRLPDGLIFRVITNKERIFKLYYQEEKSLWSGQEE